MNVIKEIRIRMGLNQQQFSEFLSQPRSTLSLSELDERCLPTSAMLKVVILRGSLITIQNNPVSSQPEDEIEELNGLLQKWGMQLEKKITETQNKLAHVKSRYQHICLINDVITQLIIQLPQNDFTDYEKSWLQLYQHRLAKRKIAFGIKNQIFMQLKIDALQYQLQRCYELKMPQVAEANSK